MKQRKSRSPCLRATDNPCLIAKARFLDIREGMKIVRRGDKQPQMKETKEMVSKTISTKRHTNQMTENNFIPDR